MRADGLGIAGSSAPSVEPPSGLAETGGLGFGEVSKAPAGTKAPPGPAEVAPPTPAASAQLAPAACAAIVQPRPRRVRRSPSCEIFVAAAARPASAVAARPASAAGAAAAAAALSVTVHPAPDSAVAARPASAAGAAVAGVALLVSAPPAPGLAPAAAAPARLLLDHPGTSLLTFSVACGALMSAQHDHVRTEDLGDEGAAVPSGLVHDLDVRGDFVSRLVRADGSKLAHANDLGTDEGSASKPARTEGLGFGDASSSR